MKENIIKLSILIFFILVFNITFLSYIFNLNVAFSSNRGSFCEICPYSQLCDEAVLEGELPLCKDPKHKDKFYINEKGEVVPRLLGYEISLTFNINTTYEVSLLKTTEVNILKNTNEINLKK